MAAIDTLVTSVYLSVLEVLICSLSCSLAFPYCPAPNFGIVLFVNFRSLPWAVLYLGFNFPLLCKQVTVCYEAIILLGYWDLTIFPNLATLFLTFYFCLFVVLFFSSFPFQ